MTDLSTYILDALSQVGVRQIFGMPGDAINGLVDAVRRHDTIEFITVRHEEAGAFAASAQAKLTGTLGVVAGTSGPGAIHLLNGLYDAKLDGAPILALTGQVETDLLGTSAHQEIDIEELFDDVAVFSESIVDPSQAPRVIDTAIREAQVKHGVSHLVIPSNLSLASVKVSEASGAPFTVPRHKPHPEDLGQAAELLNADGTSTILVGIGALHAVPEVLELSNRLAAPMVLSLRAKELIPEDHPNVTGGIGLLGTTPSVEAMERTDKLVMIGTDFPYSTFLPGEARTIQIDIDPSHIGRRKNVDVGLVGDAAETLRALIPLCEPAEATDHLDRAREAMESWNAEQKKAELDDAHPIRPQRLTSAIAAATNPGTIYVCDTGAVTAWAARHLHLEPGDRFTLSGGLASMAYGLAGAIGAQLAYPDRDVVALVGDGGFSMLMGDLITAVDLALPITVVVFNNSKLGLIEMEQAAEGLPPHAIGLNNPDFALVAQAFGADGFRVEEAADLERVLGQAIRSSNPTVVDVVIDPDELVLPPAIEPEFAWGYIRSKAKGLIDGQDAMTGVPKAVRQLVERVTS